MLWREAYLKKRAFGIVKDELRSTIALHYLFLYLAPVTPAPVTPIPGPPAPVTTAPIDECNHLLKNGQKVSGLFLFSAATGNILWTYSSQSCQ